MKINHVYFGDCIDVTKRQIPSNVIDLIFADPPYNLSGSGLKWRNKGQGGDWYMMNEKWDKMSNKKYFDFTYKWLKETKRVLKPTGSIYISCTYHNIGDLVMVAKQLGLKCLNIITWHKTNAIPNMTKRVFTHSCEYVLFLAKDKNWTFNYKELKKINPEKTKDGKQKQMRDLWLIPVCQGKERLKDKGGRAAHPTQKPEALLERIIIASSKEGDLVLDPFLGSGTTAAVAKKLGRKWIGIENNKKYFKLATKRLKQ